MSASRHVTSHPTEKPEKLLQRILLIGSKEGDMVLDPNGTVMRKLLVLR